MTDLYKFDDSQYDLDGPIDTMINCFPAIIMVTAKIESMKKNNAFSATTISDLLQKTLQVRQTLSNLKTNAEKAPELLNDFNVHLNTMWSAFYTYLYTKDIEQDNEQDDIPESEKKEYKEIEQEIKKNTKDGLKSLQIRHAETLLYFDNYIDELIEQFNEIITILVSK